MKRELVLFLIFAAGLAGSACDVDLGPFGSGSSVGSGGSDGSTGTVASSATGATGATSSATGGGGGGGEDDGGIPADCAATKSCGNFGSGCVRCAVKTACAAEYQACFDDAPCKSYSICIEPCGGDDAACLQACEEQFPSGAVEYQALTHCVICGDCATLCAHAPDTCG